ncbi:hypothetical protein FRC15_009851 [Serendipita sp. 397]|nr:hypothetical protein FRC15_009851 [Serendipita sp. 397]
MYRTEDTQMQYYPNLIQFESTTKAEDTNRNESWGLSGEERGDESQTRDASGSRIIWDEILSKIIGEHSIVWQICEHCDRPGRCKNRKSVENWGDSPYGPGTLCESCQQNFPKRVCKECGRPGRYKDGKCIEKWGRGPEGPGTACERCRKKMKRVEKGPISMSSHSPYAITPSTPDVQ